MSRVLSIAAFAAGVALLAVSANAQMGASGGGMTTSPASAPLKTMPLGGSMGPQETMQGNMGTQSGRMTPGEAAVRESDRQMTECLNTAAAQRRPLSSCRR